jgi:hypothetical protein
VRSDGWKLLLFNVFGVEKQKSNVLIFLLKVTITFYVNSICIVLGASSMSILNGVENVFSSVSLDLKFWNLELNARFVNRKGCAVFLSVSNLTL